MNQFPSDREPYNGNLQLYNKYSNIYNNILDEYTNFTWKAHPIFLMQIAAICKITNTIIRLPYAHSNKLKQEIFSDNMIEDLFYPHVQQIPPTLQVIFIEKGVHVFDQIDEIEDIKELKQISSFIKQDKGHKVRLFQTHPNKYILMTNKFLWESLRYIISLFPKLFNWDNEDLINLSKAFGGDDFQHWLDTYSQWFKQSGIIEDYKKHYIKRAVISTKQKNIRRLKQEETRLIDKLQRILDDYYSTGKQIEDLRIRILAYETTQEDEEEIEEFIDYIFRHRNIINVKVIDSRVFLSFFTPLIYYSTEPLEQALHNYSGFQKFLVEKCFLEQEFTVYAETGVEINFEEIGRFYRHGEALTNTSPVANPHIDRHNCWGDNAPGIVEALQSGDYLEALERINGALHNLNFFEYGTIRDFISDIHHSDGYDHKFIQNNETKEWFTVSELIQLYQSEKEAAS